jgi:hypothetical protein
VDRGTAARKAMILGMVVPLVTRAQIGRDRHGFRASEGLRP